MKPTPRRCGYHPLLRPRAFHLPPAADTLRPSAGQLGDKLRDAERIESRDREALLAEAVERRADVNERLAVNHQKAVVEKLSFLHGERIRVLRVELLNVHVW